MIENRKSDFLQIKLVLDSTLKLKHDYLIEKSSTRIQEDWFKQSSMSYKKLLTQSLWD